MVMRCTQVLLYAQLRDNNQGVIKIAAGALKKDPAAGEITIEHETPLSAQLNGAKNVGMVVLAKATKLAVEKAKNLGFGIVGTNNTSSSTGILGYVL